MSSQVITATNPQKSAAASRKRRASNAGQQPVREDSTTMPPPIPQSQHSQSSQPRDRARHTHPAPTPPAISHTIDPPSDEYDDVDGEAEAAVIVSDTPSIQANLEREQQIDDVMVMATSHMWEEDVIASEFENDLDENVTPPDTARWVKKARRARRNSSMRNAASWLVSILVGGFIVATVAIILLAGPGRFNAAEWLTARAATEQPQPIAAPQPKPASRVLTGSIVADE